MIWMSRKTNSVWLKFRWHRKDEKWQCTPSMNWNACSRVTRLLSVHWGRRTLPRNTHDMRRGLNQAQQQDGPNLPTAHHLCVMPPTSRTQPRLPLHVLYSKPDTRGVTTSIIKQPSGRFVYRCQVWTFIFWLSYSIQPDVGLYCSLLLVVVVVVPRLILHFCNDDKTNRV